MGLGYKVGDVVWAHFSFQETKQTKVRPVVILEILDIHRLFCKV